MQVTLKLETFLSSLCFQKHDKTYSSLRMNLISFIQTGISGLMKWSHEF